MRITTGVLAVGISILVGCANQNSQKNLWTPNQSFSGPVTILVISDVGSKSIVESAKNLQLEVTGDAVVKITGNADEIAKIQIPQESEPTVLVDESIEVVKQDTPTQADQKIYYLAKKDFGLPDYWQNNPTHDGRGVIAAAIDDGVSPVSEGIKTTSDGKRKFIIKKTMSDLLQIKMNKVTEVPLPEILSPFESELGVKWLAQIDESSLKPINRGEGILTDLNEDGAKTVIDLAVIEQTDSYKVCVDTNTSKKFETSECFGTFKATGEYGFWTANKLVSVEAEFDVATETIVLTQGERQFDSHGEGVASVMVGHNIGGSYDGVAPGAQFVDYDFTEQNNSDTFYTIGDFVTAIDWLGQQGVEVVNVSYSFFFTSAAGQAFMKKAIDLVVKKHNMVVSFSAGNNGPGLGSLNRRALYPDNVLVAGAFVSHDLDEYVHGVTALPKEGRVIYYSSRGPGPQNGYGPMVISPLASLTHSNPANGFTAFSGTSSASPALAGFATVLISSAKQLGYKIDASAIVHAIRLSGESLPGVPFIDQGYGLPKIKKALEIYAKMMSGDLFAEVRTTVMTQKGPDGLSSNGLLLKTSNLETTEHRVNLAGVFANSVDPSKAASHLETLVFNYNAKWLSGPSRLWVSVGASSFALGVDADLIRKEIASGGELNGEIEVISESTGQRVLIIPVTVIDDAKLNQKLKWQVSLGAEEGKRIHLNAGPDVQGFVVNSSVLKGGSAAVYVQTYNDSKVKTINPAKIGSSDGLFVPVEKAGHYQLGLFRSKGTVTAAEVEVIVTPVITRVATTSVSDTNRGFVVDNFGPAIDAQLILEETATVLSERMYQINKKNLFIEFDITDLKNGVYSLNIASVAAADISYEATSCLLTAFDSSGALVERLDSFVYNVMDASKLSRINVVCRPFDQTAFDSFSIDWNVKVEFLAQQQARMYEKLNVRLLPGRNSLKLSSANLPKDGVLRKANVLLQPLFSTGSIKIGEVGLY